MYDGAGDAITFELAIGLDREDPDDTYTLSLTIPVPFSSIADLVTLILDQIGALLDVLDEFFNIFTLTFLDATLGHPRVDWSLGAAACMGTEQFCRTKHATANEANVSQIASSALVGVVE